MNSLIPFFSGNFVYDLKIVGQSERKSPSLTLLYQAVIPTLASSQTVATQIEGNPGHKDHQFFLILAR